MARTDETEVRDLYSTHAEGTDASTSAVNFYIEVAHTNVNRRLDGEGYGFSDAELQRIEALLTCHYVHSTDPTEAEGTIGDESTTFEGADIGGAGLESTRFGRRAIAASDGVLADLGKPSSSFSFGGVRHDSHGRFH